MHELINIKFWFLIFAGYVSSNVLATLPLTIIFFYIFKLANFIMKIRAKNGVTTTINKESVSRDLLNVEEKKENI